MGYLLRQPSFSELLKGTDKCTLVAMHMGKLEALMVDDPKRKLRVPSCFCSFHLAGFDLDEKSNVSLRPQYQPDRSVPQKWATDHVTADGKFDMCSSCTEVTSLRVVKAGPDCAFPVEVYGKVIARDEVDYKCVFLFDRERKDAQLITSEKDMLALTGPYRPLITPDQMYFEFDLKIKGKHDHEEVQFSKGVISLFCNPDHNRIILQLPSFKSTVKLVLRHVSLPVAASIEVNVVNEGHGDTVVQYNGKITAGTTRNYRQHIVLYDSSVSSGGLVRNGSLVLNRNLVTLEGYEPLVLYVCFLDAGCEIEDEYKKRPEEEDEEEEEEEEVEAVTEEQEEEEEEDPKNVVTLKYPLLETVWEYGSPKLKVKVDWTAIPYTPKRRDYFQRLMLVPADCRSPDYRWGGFS